MIDAVIQLWRPALFVVFISAFVYVFLAALKWCPGMVNNRL